MFVGDTLINIVGLLIGLYFIGFSINLIIRWINGDDLEKINNTIEFKWYPGYGGGLHHGNKPPVERIYFIINLTVFLIFGFAFTYYSFLGLFNIK